MILIVDTNILFAGLLRNSTTRQLLLDPPCTLFAPETALKEIRKYGGEIVRRAGFTKAEFELLFNFLADNITIIEKERHAHKMREADKLIGSIDKGDVPFLALALSVPNDGIWTENVKHFSKQKKARIWTTKELLNQF
jgi:predicted nucleic acid-binding protein